MCHTPNADRRGGRNQVAGFALRLARRQGRSILTDRSDPRQPFLPPRNKPNRPGLHAPNTTPINQSKHTEKGNGSSDDYVSDDSQVVRHER